MSWTVNEIRAKFLEFFESKGHKIENSAPMVVKNDPTLMFTNAGMNQFKDIFLGNKDSDIKRIANSQKCLRVSGKHNDLEEVGVDTYHHTMFEMLGNWSFGDYFKKEAIAWAWELLVDVYKLDKSRMYVTVFEGDETDGTTADVEAEDIWKQFISADRILRCNKKDNFWEMGDMGPCGPCSEIHIDLRSDEERSKVDGKSLVNADHPQVIEIWNLVFIQYNRDAKGVLSSLPNKHVDTGMGLERLAMALQAKSSNYDTDVFAKLINKIESSCGKKYNATDSKEDVAFRVIADHVRAVAFSIADGQLPSNNGAGYVIRRILRRAVRYGYSFLGFETSFLNDLVPVLAEQMGNHFNEVKAQVDLIKSVIKEEEESFLRTLSNGIKMLEKELTGTAKLQGKVAFELYDTFGFPIDLTQLIASEKNVEVDMEGFEKALEEQKNRSRKSNELKTDDWIIVSNVNSQEFIGYDELQSESKILKYRTLSNKGKELYQIVLDKVPFYPEGGGQVGDTGLLIQGDNKLSVIDSKKENDLIVLTTAEMSLDVSEPVSAVVSSNNRRLAQANHTATHLLHLALRKVLGTHVEQKGSLVSPKYLRFDYSHFQKVTAEELRTVEDLVNQQIAEGINIEEYRETSMKEAEAAGAMMLFGEKYGDKVRMIKFGDSVELCGGTHVRNTSEIRLFKINSEASVAAGIRRIEAITSDAAIAYLNKQNELLEEIKQLLNNAKQPEKKVAELLATEKNLKAQIEAIDKEKSKVLKSEILSQLEEVNGIKYAFISTAVKSNFVKDILFQLKSEHQGLVIGIASIIEDKITFSLLVSDNVVSDIGIKANEGIKLIASAISGGGGGQPFFATAGGKNPEGFSQAKELLIDWISK